MEVLMVTFEVIAVRYNSILGLKVHKLKNKLGTKAVPTAEMELNQVFDIYFSFFALLSLCVDSRQARRPN